VILEHRVRPLNDAPLRSTGAKYVLYWSQMNRRVESNHALYYAVEKANELGLPVLVYEGLTCTYPHANDRIHTFVVAGVPETQQTLDSLGIGYCFYLRQQPTDPNDVLYQLAAHAALLVTDDYPTFIASWHNSSVPAKLALAYHAVDSSCIVPMNRYDKREWAAYSIRPKIKRMLPDHLEPVPALRPLHRFSAPRPAWHTDVNPTNVAALVAACAIDHTIAPSIAFPGGRAAAERALQRFLVDRLSHYARDKNSPSNHVTSELSPYLHFGIISSLEIALAVEGYAAEHKLIVVEFLEELIVRRELAFNFTRFTPNYDQLDCLPDWARKTLAKHDPDRREFVYTEEQFLTAQTHDPLWNACQQEMLLRGKIHGYYRMYWGKKIIEWSATHADALRTMIKIHDIHALDGRDPNTYTGVLWCFGLHDRPWQERGIFGMVRFMGFDGMKRKTDVDSYLRDIAQMQRTGLDAAPGASQLCF